jgi:hypothetical protein
MHRRASRGGGVCVYVCVCVCARAYVCGIHYSASPWPEKLTKYIFILNVFLYSYSDAGRFVLIPIYHDWVAILLANPPP